MLGDWRGNVGYMVEMGEMYLVVLLSVSLLSHTLRHATHEGSSSHPVAEFLDILTY